MPSRSPQAQVESRMRWDEVLSRAAEEAREDRPADRSLGPWISVSRQAGSGGGEVAAAVGEALGWSVLDKELVDGLADRLRVDSGVLRLQDETRSNWFEDTLLNLLDSKLVLQSSYVELVGRIVLLAAYRGSVVVVGRGANLMLLRQGGLRVRIVAPRAWRIDHLAAREGLGAGDAAARVDELDRARSEFIRRHFRREPDDPDGYDLVVDAATFGIGGAAELVGAAARRLGLVGAAKSG